jgi:hypothetical protein
MINSLNSGMKKLITLIWLLGMSLGYSQSIINTESILKDIDSASTINFNIEGDLKYGNIKLIELNNQLTYAKKFGRNLIRLSLGQEYLEEDNEKLANDWVGQARLNHYLGLNSIFSFVQIQNAVSLNLKSRYLFGGGYRQNLYTSKEDDSNYFDLSAGVFRELEAYGQENDADLKIENWRYSLSAFSNFDFFKSFSLNTSVYYQLNSANLKDVRFFVEPRLYYKRDNFGIYLTNRYRYHSTPYVPVKKEDQEYLFGLEISL